LKSSYSGESREGLLNVVLCVTHVESLLVKLDFGADCTDPASIGIDNTTADSNARIETHLSSRLLTKSPDKLAGGKVASIHFVNTSHALEVVIAQILQSNLLEKIFLPPFHAPIDPDRNKSLLANDTAIASSIASSGQVGEGIAKIVELAAVEDFFWHVVLQPQNFRNLHLDGHLPSNIAKKVVASSVDLLSLLDRSVIQPQNDIAIVAVSVVKVRAGYADRLVCVFCEDGKRACSVESNATDGVSINAVLVHSSAY